MSFGFSFGDSVTITQLIVQFEKHFKDVSY